MATGRVSCAAGVGLCLSLLGCAAPGGGGLRAPAARDPYAAGRFNAEGLALVDQGDCPLAESKFRAALQSDPFYGPAHCNLGVSLLEQGKFYEAGWALQFACKLMPKAAQPRANLGILYEAVGRYAEAESELRAALELSPEDIEVIGQLARVHVRQNKHTEQTRDWLQAVASQDDDPTWRGWAREQLIRHDGKQTENGR